MASSQIGVVAMLLDIFGKQYLSEGFSPKVRKAFEEFVRYHELQEIKAAKLELDEEDYFRLLRQHITLRSADTKFGSTHFFHVIRDPEKMTELMWYTFYADEEKDIDQPSRDVIKKWVETEIDEVMALFWGFMDESRTNGSTE